MARHSCGHALLAQQPMSEWMGRTEEQGALSPAAAATAAEALD